MKNSVDTFNSRLNISEEGFKDLKYMLEETI